MAPRSLLHPDKFLVVAGRAANTSGLMTPDAENSADQHKLPVLRLPIMAGPMKGTRWFPSSGGKILRVFLGTYEPEQTALFAEHLEKGSVLFDVGAHVGYYSLLSARLVGEKGRVISLEPNPHNAAFLEGHVRINQADNVTVLRTAASDSNGTLHFAAGTGTGTGHLAEEGELEVKSCMLDTMAAEQNVMPTHIKIDVEGAELSVLKGAQKVLTEARPVIFLSTHGAGVHAACCKHLEDLGYQLSPIFGDDLKTTSEVLCIPGNPKE